MAERKQLGLCVSVTQGRYSACSKGRKVMGTKEGGRNGSAFMASLPRAEYSLGPHNRKEGRETRSPSWQGTANIILYQERNDVLLIHHQLAHMAKGSAQHSSMDTRPGLSYPLSPGNTCSYQDKPALCWTLVQMRDSGQTTRLSGPQLFTYKMEVKENLLHKDCHKDEMRMLTEHLRTVSSTYQVPHEYLTSKIHILHCYLSFTHEETCSERLKKFAWPSRKCKLKP